MFNRVTAATIAAVTLFSIPVFGPETAQAAKAKAFPASTTIYVISGVRDTGGADNTGTSSVVHCSNVSGVQVSVRVVALYSYGGVAGSATRVLANGASTTFTTRNTAAYTESAFLGGGTIAQGVFNVESTNAAVFCSAMTIDAAASSPIGVPLHMVRVNGLPGAQE